MDTSSKPEVLSGTSPKETLDFLMGRKKIPIAQLSAADWLAIIREILETILRPQLKYLAGFKEVEVFLQRIMPYFSAGRFINKSILRLPESISLATRVIWLLDLGSLDHSDEWLLQPNFDRNIQSCDSAELLLTREGRFILWATTYERKLAKDEGRGDYILENAIFSQIYPLEFERLGGIFAENTLVGLKILDTLLVLVAETIKASQERLQKMQIIQQKLAETRGLIDAPPSISNNQVGLNVVYGEKSTPK
jgi:hypothetical protein